jgi:hypothetical protein
MFEQLQSVFSGSGFISAAVLGMLMAMYKAASILSSAMDLHERHFVRKRHKRLQELRSSISNNGAFTRYLDDAIQLEAFRIEFGIRVSPLKALALLNLWERGYWDRNQIGHIARFLIITPTESVPVIRITRADKVGAWAGLISGVITMLGGAVFWIAITLIDKTLYSYLAGGGLFCMFSFAAVLFATGYGRYKNALGVEKYLRDHPDTLGHPSNFMNTFSAVESDTTGAVASDSKSGKKKPCVELA